MTNKEIQKRLHAWGFYNGAIDGILGQKTQAAIERFQEDQCLAINGRADSKTKLALSSEPAWRRREYRGSTH